MTGKRRAPSAAIARRRMTPVVVSSVPASTSATCAGPRVVEERDEVAAVVHRHLRVRVGDRVEVRVVGVAVLAAPGVDGDPVRGDERGRDVVLGRERVARRPARPRAPPAVSVRIRFAVSVVTWRQAADAQAGQRPLALEALADEPQDRHLALGPLDAADALGGQAEIGHVVGGQARRWSSVRTPCGGRRSRRSGATRLRPRRAEPVDEALLEADVLAVAELAVGRERRRVVGRGR